MVFGRMVYYYLPERKLFRIQAISIAKYFVWLDVVSFLVQGSGGSLISSEDAKTSRLGINIYMGGVGLQEFFILLFIGMTICFHRRVSQLIEQGQLDAGKNGAKKLVWTLYVVLGLITVRIIFRLVEFSSGVENNILIENETFIYVFDAVPMVFAAGLLNVIHPGRYLVGEESEFPPGLTRKEKKALKAEKKERKRWEKEERMRERGGKGRIASLFGGRKRGGDSTEDLDNRYRGGQAEEGRRGIPLEGRNGV